MKFPSIKTVAAELRGYKAELRTDHSPRHVCHHLNDPDGPVEQWVDVRFQVDPEEDGGGFAIHVGDPQYDTDHRGYWGAGCLGLGTNCYDLARELLEEAREHHAQAQCT